MTDREKAIKGLNTHFSKLCSKCPYVYETACSDKLLYDVLNLLKQQEAKEPDNERVELVTCRNCGNKIVYRGKIYCPNCGAKFKEI